MKRNERDVGNMGEKHFSSLCSSVGITANKSEIDNKGWDYIVEFPFEFTAEYNDLIETPIKCLVQVKATDNKKCSSWSITLKNLLHFIKTPLPTFFCLINFDNEDSPQSIFLLHIDKNLIEETLKTFREYSVYGKNIGNTKKSIHFKKEHLLQEISGKSLKNAIKKYIPMGIDRYSKDKTTLVNTIGYEEGAAEFFMTTNPFDFRDLSLGIINEMEINSFQLFDKRFGISSLQPKISMDTGKIRIEPEPTREITMMFSPEEYGIGVVIKFQVYTSGIDEHLPFEKRKLRLKSNFIELIIELSLKNTFTFHVENENKKFYIDELNKNYELLKMIKDGNCLYTSISHNDEFLPSGVASIKKNSSIAFYFKLFEIAHKFYKILEKFNLNNLSSISLKQLRNYEDGINDFYEVAISNNKHLYSIIFHESENIKNKDGVIYSPDIPSKVAGIISVSVIIEKHRVICIFAIIADKITINTDGKYELKSEESDYYKFLIFPSSREISEEMMDKEFNKVAEKISLDGIVPIRVINS